MIKLVGIFISIILTSFYLFPFEFKFLPNVNTKMAMAGIGLVLLAFQLLKRKLPVINCDFIQILAYALLISYIGLISWVYNDTVDYSFFRYVIPVVVWWSGAYCLSIWLKNFHGYLSVELVGRYIIATSVLQCVLAICIDRIHSLKLFVNSFLGGEEFFMIGLEGRLYGIGCALDVAGLKFAAVLTMVAFLSTRKTVLPNFKWTFFYLFSTFVIVIIGNMIGRSTSIGMMIALIYWLYIFISNKPGALFVKKLFISILIIFPLVVLLYNTSDITKDYLRFGFEGFFSLWEKGRWEVSSNEILKNMVVFPDNLKTWIIGDAYAINPIEYDPNYIGPSFKGYYMNTDIGYLRFIFYFGILGCFSMILFIYQVTKVCIKRFPMYMMFFIMILCVNLIGWCKVSTDIFMIFALFLCVNREENTKYEEFLINK